MNRKKSFFALSVLLLVTASALAQNQGPRPIPLEIHGQVRYADGNAPAENVLVRVESFRGGVISPVRTDRLGKFTFTGLAPIQYTVTVRTVGFVELQQQVDLQTQNSAYLLFSLRPEKIDQSASPNPELFVHNAKVSDASLKEYEAARALLADAKKIPDAVTHLEKAVSRSPMFLEAQLLLGTAYMDLHRWNEAEGALKRVLKIDEQTPSALFALGELYLQEHRNKEAEEALKNGLRLENNSWRGHLALSRLYFSMGDMAKAGPEVGRAIQLKPDFAEAHLLGGNILFKAHQADKALPLFEEYLKLEPNGPYAAETRALVAKIKNALGLAP